MGVLDGRETLSSAIQAWGAAVSDLGRGAVQLVECVAFLELGVYEIRTAKEESERVCGCVSV